MATKKSTKKVKPKLPILNKKNMKDLADKIYSDKKGEVKFLKLCNGHLVDGEDNGRTLHCAIGEAYYTFVAKSFSDTLIDDDQFEATNFAIAKLADIAILKNLTDKKKLCRAFEVMSEINDDYLASNNEYLTRSKEVAKVIYRKVLPLLK